MPLGAPTRRHRRSGRGPGKANAPRSNRKSGNLAIGGVLSSARETPEGDPMRTTRLRRLASACRLPFLVLSLSVVVPAALRAADALSGLVVDQSGRPLPRALVRIVDASGAEIARLFSDEAGRFRAGGAPEGCGVRVTLD